MSEEAARPSYESGTGFLLARLGVMVERSWSSLLARHNLTQAQYAALSVLTQHGPIGQGRLATLMAIDPRNVVAVVDGLAELGLAERRVDRADGRRRQIHLTARGDSICRAVADDARTTQAAFLETLDQTEQATLNRMLLRLYDNHVARDPGS